MVKLYRPSVVVQEVTQLPGELTIRIELNINVQGTTGLDTEPAVVADQPGFVIPDLEMVEAKDLLDFGKQV